MFWAYQGRPLSALADVCKAYQLRAARDNEGDKSKPLSPATIRNRIRYLTAACRYAWKHAGMGTHDPAARVTVPEVRNERQTCIGRAEMLRIARACTNRQARMVIRVAFYSGMRLSEILSARVVGGCWMLDDSKNGMPRMVPIHPRVAICARKLRPTPEAKLLKKITVQRCWQKARANRPRGSALPRLAALGRERIGQRRRRPVHRRPRAGPQGQPQRAAVCAPGGANADGGSGEDRRPRCMTLDACPKKLPTPTPREWARKQKRPRGAFDVSR